MPAKPLPATQREERQGERLEVAIVDNILPEIEGNVPVDGPGGVQNNVGGAVHHPDCEKLLQQLLQAISKISLLLNALESL